MTGFEIDSAALRQSAEALDAVAAQVDGALDRFDTRLASLGDAWGADDLGFLIGQAYLPGLDTAMTCFDNNTAALFDWCDRLDTMADSYDDTEDGNASTLTAMQSRFDGVTQGF